MNLPQGDPAQGVITSASVGCLELPQSAAHTAAASQCDMQTLNKLLEFAVENQLRVKHKTCAGDEVALVCVLVKR